MAVRQPVLLLLLVIPYVVSGCSRGLHATAENGRLNADDPKTCQACLWGIRLLDDSLCDDGVSDFVARFVIDKVCSIAKDKAQCQNLAVALVPVGLQYLRASLVPAQLCGNAGVCGKHIMKFPEYTKTRALPVGGVMECQFCKVIVERVKMVLDNPESEEKVREEAVKVCKTMVPELQDSCITFVNNNEAAFFAFIDMMQPREVCAMAGACFPHLVADHPLPPISAPLATSLSNVLNAPKLAGAGNDLCDTCKIVVLEAHQMVTSPKTQRQIEDFLEQLCASFGSAKDECNALMDEYLPMLLEILAEYLVPEQLCEQIGYCHKTSGMQKLFNAMRLRNLPLVQAKFNAFQK